MESHDGITFAGENQRTWRKTCPIAALSTENPAWTDLGLCRERLATNHLTHGVANNLLL
jgi:hypothetical protein